MTVRKVQRLVTGQPATDGAGVHLVRIIGQPALTDLDPFLLLDAFRSDDANDYIAGFPSHPHRGFETVTYLLNGRMRHRDNAGNEGIIESGGIQWMTAGSGIVHSEMPEQEHGLLEGFQLWINLPATHKMTAPAYQEHSKAEIPLETRSGTNVRVISGRTTDGTEGPVAQPLTDPLYLDVELAAGVTFTETLPQEHSAFVYVIQGEALLDDIGDNRVHLGRDQLAVLTPGSRIECVAGDATTRFLLVAARPLNEPIARAGPFVMNTEAEVRQAFFDYQTGNF